MLKTTMVTLTHHKDLKNLVKDVTFTVRPGDKMAIIGDEGTGKSTLLQAFLDPELINDYATLSGQVQLEFDRVAYLPQVIPQHQLDMTVADFIYTDLDNNTVDFNIFYQLAQQFHLAIEPMLTENLHLKDLSGGQQLKLYLLTLLANQPDCLFLDEPSNNLDSDSLNWLAQFIAKTQQTVIFISHDEHFLSQTATAILHLELLKKRQEPRATYFKGSYDSYKAWRQETFERQTQLALKERSEHAAKLAKSHRIHQSVEHQLRHTKNDVAGRLLAKKLKNVLSQEKRYEKERQGFHDIPENPDHINLFFSDIHPLASNKVILKWEEQLVPFTHQSIDLTIWGQDKLVITGANGIGKSNLLSIILNDLSRQYPVGFMPQTYAEDLNPDQTALTFLSDHASSSSSTEIRTLLASLQFTRQEIGHPIGNLSGGQQGKLFLAKMVLAKYPILILDEPTRHFSPTSQPLIRQLLREYPGAIISVSHDQCFIDEVCQKVFELEKDGLRRIR